MTKLGTSILALLLSGTAHAANIDIQWTIQQYEDTTAQVGDTITFTWASGHNVYIHPSGSCDTGGAILVGETSPATYTFTADDVDEDLFFVCAIAGHCDAGQTITVSVTDAAVDPAITDSVAPSSVPVVASGSATPTEIPVEGESGSVAPTALVAEGETGSVAPTGLAVEGETVTPAPTPFQSVNDTEVPTISPMEEEAIPSVGPSTVGGPVTPAPTAALPAGSSAPSRSMAGVASAALATALVWLIE